MVPGDTYRESIALSEYSRPSSDITVTEPDSTT